MQPHHQSQYFIKFPLLKLSKTNYYRQRFRNRRISYVRLCIKNRNLLKLSCTCLARRKHLNGFRRQKSLKLQLVMNFIVAKSLQNSR